MKWINNFPNSQVLCIFFLFALKWRIENDNRQFLFSFFAYMFPSCEQFQTGIWTESPYIHCVSNHSILNLTFSKTYKKFYIMPYRNWVTLPNFSSHSHSHSKIHIYFCFLQFLVTKWSFKFSNRISKIHEQYLPSWFKIQQTMEHF